MSAFLSMGLNVVNVEYRLAQIATAPAATEDCRCALRRVIQHAKEYGIDVKRIVVGGQSAGGGVLRQNHHGGVLVGIANVSRADRPMIAMVGRLGAPLGVLLVARRCVNAHRARPTTSPHAARRS